MVELIVNGKHVELYKKGNEVKYTKQIADIFDLSVVASSYTNSFNIPKTPYNTQILEGLGIVGDQSSVPYSKTLCSIRSNGFDLVHTGWLNIVSTSGDYKASIIDGMIDFFKAIENKTIGVDLDLSNFTHNKDLETVVNSYDNEYYNYIVADYGGKNMIIETFPIKFSISIDYLVPSFSMKKLFELIFSTFGYTYDSQEIDDFLEDLFITYPTPPTYESNEEDNIATLTKNNFTSSNFIVSGNKITVSELNNWDVIDINEGSLINNVQYVIPETSGYNFTLSVEAYARYYNSLQGQIFVACKAEILKNGTSILSIDTDPYTEISSDVNIFCQEGDIISYSLYVTEPIIGIRPLNSIHHNNTEFNVNKINQGDVTPSDAFKDLKIKDFFKEILYRTGLIPIADRYTKKITFIKVSDRVNTDYAIDWSNKFVKRQNEIYLKSGYAQRNIFKMKYNEGTDKKNDGILAINNTNIEEEKTLVQSIFYSPNDGKTEFIGVSSSDRISTAILPMYQKETDTDENDNIIINHKQLDSRFYLLRRNSVTGKNWRFKSQIVPGEQIVNRIYFASTEDTLLGQLITKNFYDYLKIFNNFRLQEIELALGFDDVINLDLTKPYYLSQESSYYILNKITFQEGQNSIGEFVKINF